MQRLNMIVPVSVEENTVKLCESHANWRGICTGLRVGNKSLLDKQTLTYSVCTTDVEYMNQRMYIHV